MITFNYIGRFGRLGNHMFHYASTVGIANKYGYECEFNFDHKNCHLHRIFKLSKRSYPQKKLPINIWREPSFKCSERMFNAPDNVALVGNLQCYKYFSHCFNLIRNEFIFNDMITKKINGHIDCSKFVAVHIRRTDYLQHDRYVHLDLDWYYSAMNQFPQSNFLIFSDDIIWCKNNIKGNQIYYSPFKTNTEDMCAMSICKGNIIANSTFSWWSGFLNSNDNVVCPKKWFTIPQLDETNLILDNWKTI